MIALLCSRLGRGEPTRYPPVLFSPFSSTLLLWHFLVCRGLLCFDPSAPTPVGKSIFSRCLFPPFCCQCPAPGKMLSLQSLPRQPQPVLNHPVLLQQGQSRQGFSLMHLSVMPRSPVTLVFTHQYAKFRPFLLVLSWGVLMLLLQCWLPRLEREVGTQTLFN